MKAACGPSSWWKGNNQKVPGINLDPKKRPKENLTVFQGPLTERDAEYVSSDTGNGHVSNGSNGNTNNNVSKILGNSCMFEIIMRKTYHKYFTTWKFSNSHMINKLLNHFDNFSLLVFIPVFEKFVLMIQQLVYHM